MFNSIAATILEFNACHIGVLLFLCVIVDQLYKQWPQPKSTRHTPKPVEIHTVYHSLSKIPRWRNDFKVNHDKDHHMQTPIQRIPGLRHLRLQQRVKVMVGVRRRIDF